MSETIASHKGVEFAEENEEPISNLDLNHHFCSKRIQSTVGFQIKFSTKTNLLQKSQNPASETQSGTHP